MHISRSFHQFQKGNFNDDMTIELATFKVDFGSWNQKKDMATSLNFVIFYPNVPSNLEINNNFWVKVICIPITFRIQVSLAADPRDSCLGFQMGSLAELRIEVPNYALVKPTVCSWKWPFRVDLPIKKSWISVLMLVCRRLYDTQNPAFSTDLEQRTVPSTAKGAKKTSALSPRSGNSSA